LLLEKGIFTKEEFLGMVRVVDRDMKKAKQRRVSKGLWSRPDE